MSEPRKLFVPLSAEMVQPHFHCPECKTENPPYGFTLNRYDLGLVGSVEYFTIYCGAPKRTLKVDPEKRELAEPELCGCILSVCIMAYQPPTDPQKQRALAEAIRRAGGFGPAQG